MYDNICKYLAETYPEDIAKWLLGQPIPLVHLPTRELALEPKSVESSQQKLTLDVGFTLLETQPLRFALQYFPISICKYRNLSMSS